MATAPNVKAKRALISLLEKFDDLIEESSATMTDEEFKAAEAKADGVFEQVKARVSQRGKRERA